MNGDKLFESMNLIEDQFLDESLETSIKPLTAKHKHIVWINTIASVAAVFLIFVGTINLFPATAYAMRSIPGLRELVAAVTYDPSMKACLNNEYAQYVGVSASDHGYSAKVYYMVVDAGSISVFFECDTPRIADNHDSIFFTIDDRLDSNGNVLTGSGGLSETNVKNLYEFRMDLNDNTEIPKSFEFPINFLSWNDNQESFSTVVASIQFTLYPDSYYATVVDSYPINKTLEINGQTIILDKLAVYPTKSKLYFSTDGNNSALLNDIQITLYDEKGNSFPALGDGMTSHNGEVLERWYESPYFAKAKSITAVITSVAFMDKDSQKGIISFKNRSIENIPEGVRVSSMVLGGDGTLAVSLEKTLSVQHNDAYAQAASMRFSDINGNTYYLNNIFWHSNDDVTLHYEDFEIPNFEENNYLIEWIYAPSVDLSNPIKVEIKCN
ncbi:MAG: hypothetical protein K0S76_80 [Herbinix sp.]|jgi:uncharacterized membrane protein|nr:hypothetical protein [Herbinix sp.]